MYVLFYERRHSQPQATEASAVLASDSRSVDAHTSHEQCQDSCSGDTDSQNSLTLNLATDGSDGSDESNSINSFTSVHIADAIEIDTAKHQQLRQSDY